MDLLGTSKNNNSDSHKKHKKDRQSHLLGTSKNNNSDSHKSHKKNRQSHKKDKEGEQKGQAEYWSRKDTG